VIKYGEFPPSLREKRDARGQIVIRRGRAKDRNGVIKERGVRWMVREIISPFGTPLEMRTPKTVGGEVGRWKGTDGEVRKVTMRQRGRKAGAGGKSARSMNKEKGVGPDGKGRGKEKEGVVVVKGVKGGKEELLRAKV